ncbi:DNA/RNA-binding protein KIN17 [Nymphon striatum]|nr:DNA/RNA-binding protein KIN17 [Nymphon striatum]
MATANYAPRSPTSMELESKAQQDPPARVTRSRTFGPIDKEERPIKKTRTTANQQHSKQSYGIVATDRKLTSRAEGRDKTEPVKSSEVTEKNVAQLQEQLRKVHFSPGPEKQCLYQGVRDIPSLVGKKFSQKWTKDERTTYWMGTISGSVDGEFEMKYDNEDDPCYLTHAEAIAMPKAEAGTPKAIANRIKAKGLQKLRWYCQMCQKQCRDENGFKCHTMSESHQRQLLLFADSPHKFLGTYSKEFKDSFVNLIKRQYGTKRVFANMVYQEYINDRDHTHMNSTQWETLTDFVKWLGKQGICTVDQTEKGWFMTYIDRDPETIQRQESIAKKEKMDLDDEERTAKFVAKQVQKAKKVKVKVEVDSSTYTEFNRENEDEKITFKFGQDKESNECLDKSRTLMPPPNKIFMKENQTKRRNENKESESKKKKSALDDIIQEQERMKEKRNRKDYWLMAGIVVKIMSKKVGDKYYKQKAVVQEVIEFYTAKVKMLESGDVLKLDQSHLETVIPACGRLVRIVNGAYRGEKAILQKVITEDFCVTLEIASGLTKGRVIEKIPYEDFSKLYKDS